MIDKVIEHFLKPPAVPDTLKQFTSFFNIYKNLKEEAAPAGDGPANWKVALAQSLGGKIDTILERVEKTVGNYARAQEHRAAVMLAGRGFQVRMTPEASTLAESQPGTAVPGPQTSATPTAGPGETAPPESPPGAPVLPMGDFIKSKLVEMLFAGKEGDAGAIFAEAMDVGFAEQIARTMKENPSALATDNILAQATRHPNAQKFCEAYVGYFEEEEEPAPEGTTESTE